MQYAAVLEAIRTGAEEYNIDGIEPKLISSDFEQAIINAIFENFPESDLQLCFFHLKQSLYRHVQSLGLQTAYNDEQDFKVKDFCHIEGRATTNNASEGWHNRFS